MHRWCNFPSNRAEFIWSFNITVGRGRPPDRQNRTRSRARISSRPAEPDILILLLAERRRISTLAKALTANTLLSLTDKDFTVKRKFGENFLVGTSLFWHYEDCIRSFFYFACCDYKPDKHLRENYYWLIWVYIR